MNSLLALALPIAAAGQDDMDIVRARLLAEWHAGSNAAAALSQAGQLQVNGSWADIDYAAANTTNWPAILHMERINLMTRALTDPASSAHGDTGLRAAIGSALEFWFVNDFTNANWWYNEIGVPRQLAPAMLMLGDGLTSRELEQGLRIIGRAKIQGESQNLVWLTEVNAQRGLIIKDPALVATAYNRIAQEIRIVGYDGEGTQADWSFLQHRRCLYNHGYGTSFVIDGARIAAQVAGTRYAFSGDKVQLLAALLLDGSQWMTRYRWADFGARGREFTRQAQTTAGWMITAADHLLRSDTGRDAELQALKLRAAGDINAPMLNGNRMFWRGDTMVHHRDAYYLSVRMYSSRLANTDFNGPENQYGHHLADGVTAISRKGSEYDQIYPVWDWQKLPGITARQSPPLTAGAPRRENGSSAFAGGVSNGRHGVAAFDFERDGLKAKKAWFLTDRGMVALGAGITDLSGNPVQTTLNQTSRAILSVQLSRGVWHDNVAYISLDSNPIQSAITSATGSWSKINVQQSAAPVTRSLFTAWIDHGSRPVLKSYAYLVEPGVSSDQARASSDNPPVSVASNTTAVQAVWDPHSRAGGAVFYAAGSVTLAEGLQIAAAQTGALLAEYGPDGLRVWYADPTQLLGGIVTATVNGRAWHALLPSGQHAGSSVELRPLVLEAETSPVAVLRYNRPGEAGAHAAYTLESSADPAAGPWAPVPGGASVVASQDGWDTVEVPLDMDSAGRFYRLRIAPLQ